MTSYSVRVELDQAASRRALERADEWLDDLTPVAGVPVGVAGRLGVLCTVDAEGLHLAVGTAAAVVTRVTRRAVVAVEAMSREERDRRDAAERELAAGEQVPALPELISAAEAGQIMNLTPQRVRELAADGRLVAQAVGERATLVVVKASAEQAATVARRPGRPPKVKA